MRQRYEIVQPGESFDPAVYRLGAPCKRNHLWDEVATLRTVKARHCPLCERIDAIDRQKHRRLQNRVGENAKAAAYKRQARADGRIPSRSKYGLPYMPTADSETQAMRKAIRQAGCLSSVAKLVYDQQHEHWQQHPADYRQYNRERSKHNFRWRYMSDPSFRLYHRSKARERKAKEHGSTSLKLSADQLWRRWVQFNHCCAYCGVIGDLHIEHVIPISKGGEHHLGNIVPACQRCNFSKHTREVQTWYRSQPFFDETRWHHIQSLLAQSQPSFQQLVFL
jgi:5-methylcytosine-specific restriction endonuclease McrA